MMDARRQTGRMKAARTTIRRRHGARTRMPDKPLLILPPAPARQAGLERLLTEESETRRADLVQRFCVGLPHARDALAIATEATTPIACAVIRRRGTVGVFGQLYTAPPHRGKGHCRRLTQTLLSWFDMSGGKWLYAHTRVDLYERFLTHFGFAVLHRLPREQDEYVMLLRRPAAAAPHPFARLNGAFGTRRMTRADWPLVVALLNHYPGPDPRISPAESALAAENAAFDLFAQQEAGAVELIGLTAGKRLAAVASVALDRKGDRTHAMVIPHDRADAAAREAIAEFARTQSYTHVDYPFESLVASASSPAPASPDEPPAPA
ncbi:MAG: N-acetyltransferase [Planctomycetota bacterium]|nr:MAG: N-acetyltransferase [Planctomycetota bacterium]